MPSAPAVAFADLIHLHVQHDEHHCRALSSDASAPLSYGVTPDRAAVRSLGL